MSGLTLLQLAQKARCSESLISKIENGSATPSLASLHRLAVALKTNIVALTSPVSPPPGPVTRSGERLVIDGAISLERITLPAENGLLQANIHIIGPGVATDGMIEHIGEEVGYVLEGAVELILGDERYLLHAGYNFNFPSDVPHDYRNPAMPSRRFSGSTRPPPTESNPLRASAASTSLEQGRAILTSLY